MQKNKQMQPFIHDDFLLQNEPARRLYHEYARDLPIVDFHNHLPPEEIAANSSYENITAIWLKGDHYKWRAMRVNGVQEHYITGAADDREKFLRWAETVPKTLKNPLYHWTHLELKRYFGIDRLLDASTASDIWGHTREQLQGDEMRTRPLLKNKGVRVVCTTDDAVDTLEHHGACDPERIGFSVWPTFRPDRAMQIEDPASFLGWLNRLREVSGVDVDGWESFIEALRQRHDHFDHMGCRASDHGLSEPWADDFTATGCDETLQLLLQQKPVDEGRQRAFKSALMVEFARMNHEKDWAFQMHIGAQRNNNTRAFKQLGPDSGYDSIGDRPVAQALARFLDRLDAENSLPRTILYNLNPADNAVFATMTGNFAADGIPGKVQYGPAWWFHDQKEGMEEHLQVLSNMSLLSRFVGMVTDSRSFLSFPRHEYFRRILCNMLGDDLEKGIVPADYALLGEMISDLCYRNALSYFEYKHTGA